MGMDVVNLLDVGGIAVSLWAYTNSDNPEVKTQWSTILDYYKGEVGVMRAVVNAAVAMENYRRECSERLRCDAEWGRELPDRESAWEFIGGFLWSGLTYYKVDTIVNRALNAVEDLMGETEKKHMDNIRKSEHQNPEMN